MVKFLKAEAEKIADLASLKAVFEHGSKIDLDHHLVYHARIYSLVCLESTPQLWPHPGYELGHLFARQGSIDAARHEFELVLSGKPLDVNASGRKCKYSLEVCPFSSNSQIMRLLPLCQKNALHLWTWIQALQHRRPVSVIHWSTQVFNWTDYRWSPVSKMYSLCRS